MAKVLCVKMKRISVIIALVVAAVAVSVWWSLSGQQRGLCAERMALADSVILQAIGQDDFPGAVLCVVRRAEDGESMGKIEYLKAYGNRMVARTQGDANEWIADSVKMTTDAIFDLASVSKCVGTTLSLMRLVEDGKVRIDDKVVRYIPDFAPWQGEAEEQEAEGAKAKSKRQKPRMEKVDITLRHLLNHTSGLAPGIHAPSFMRRYEKWGPLSEQNLRDSLITYLAHDAARNTRPGEKMRYSCLNFIVLQAVIERVSGERLDKFAGREVFEPLGLENTWYNAIDEMPPFEADAPIVPTEIVAHEGLLYGQVHDPTARLINRGVSGNAGLFSTAEDLARVASMLLNGGVLREEKKGFYSVIGITSAKRLYSQRAVDTFFRLAPECVEHGRTLGWDTGSFGDLEEGQRVINHTGYTGTSISMNLDEGLAIIFLTNRVHPKDDGAVGRTRALLTNIIHSAIDR